MPSEATARNGSMASAFAAAKKKAERLIANPPFSQNYSLETMKFKERFRHFMPESGKKADLMFVQHMVASLKSDGKMAVVMGSRVDS